MSYTVSQVAKEIILFGKITQRHAGAGTRHWGVIYHALPIAVLLVAALLAAACGGSPEQSASVNERTLPDEGGGHVRPGAPLTFRNNPPASGKHYDEWVRPYGVYPDAIPEGYWVHNLEHGAIVVLYKCPEGQSSCEDSDLFRQLQTLFEAAPPGKYGEVKIVATQYPKLKTPVAALAWNRILELPAYDQNRLIEFYRAHVDRGPEDVP